jgi:hypothetical protein
MIAVGLGRRADESDEKGIRALARLDFIFDQAAR